MLEARERRLQQDLTARESRIKELESFLPLAKKLQEMGLALEDALPWIQSVKEIAQIEKLDTKSASLYVSQELALNRQLRGIRGQIERANHELALINMTTMNKQQALNLLIELSNRGVTESQIVGLIDFAGQWYSNLQQQQQLQSNGPGPASLQQLSASSG
jgi:hypothetical protein